MNMKTEKKIIITNIKNFELNMEDLYNKILLESLEIQKFISIIYKKL